MNQARDELEREVLTQYRALGRSLKATSEPRWMEIDLTLPQLRTLLVLAEEGPLVIGQIAQRLGIGLSTGGHLVDRLVQADLAELTALQAPSGSEQPVIARLRDLFTPLVDTVTVDHMGNLTATREGPEPQAAPHVVVSAHADEIGALVARIEPEGFLRLLPLGGVQPRLLEGRAVWVGGRTGVIGARSGHLTPVRVA